MHYHCEIIIPQNENIDDAVKAAMCPFDESLDNDDDIAIGTAWWDYYVIGGRFAGSKFAQKLDQGKLDEFHAWCHTEHVTVNYLQCGKQKLDPDSQIPKVDAKWKEMFGEDTCSLFAHSNDQYHGRLDGDVSRLGDSLSVTCWRVLFTGRSLSDGKLEPTFMLVDSIHNGVNYMPIQWDTTVGDALNKFMEQLKGYRNEYAAVIRPTDDWACVTVDYHS